MALVWTVEKLIPSGSVRVRKKIFEWLSDSVSTLSDACRARTEKFGPIHALTHTHTHRHTHLPFFSVHSTYSPLLSITIWCVWEVWPQFTPVCPCLLPSAFISTAMSSPPSWSDNHRLRHLPSVTWKPSGSYTSTKCVKSHVLFSVQWEYSEYRLMMY